MTSRTLCGLLIVALLAACEGDRPTVADVAVLAAPKRPTAVFVTTHGEVPVALDLARTPAQREKGLMWVEHLDPGRGMLFLMGPPERPLTFWMKNTYIPLDMIFISAKLEVVGVVEQAEPLTLTPRRVEGSSLYVVEVNGGWAAKNGVTAGTKVRFEDVE